MSDENATTDEGVALETTVPVEQVATEQPQEQPPQEAAKEPEQQPEVNERKAKLEAIAQKRMQDMAVKLEPVTEQASEPEPDPEGEPVERTPRTHKLKVNGEEQEVTFEEMRTMAQKAAAADQKFQQAAEKEKSIEQRMKEFEEKLAQQSSATPPNQDVSRQQAVPKDQPMQFTPEVIDQAQFGGDEEGQRAREEMARRLNQQPINPTAIKDSIRAEIRVESAIESVSQADPIAKQILDDPAMKQTANEYSAMLLRLEPNLSEAENIAKACQQARIHFPDLQAPEKPPEMAPAKQVTQTKQAHSAGNVSTPAQRISVAPAPLTQEQIRAQGRSQLRQGRGL